jgi:hypothetical protein
MNTHTFNSTGEAYDASQCDDAIRDGDLLHVPSEGVVGILCGAWPVAVTAAHGAFHTLGAGASWAALGGNEARTDTYWVHPCKYVVVIDGEPVEFDGKLDAEDAAREARTTVRRVDGEPYEHTEHIAAKPATDYTPSVEAARKLAGSKP